MEKKGIDKLLSLFPRGLYWEINTILGSRNGGKEGLDEVRLIANGKSSLVYQRENLYLSYKISDEEMEKILSDICSGATYAYRDSIKQGFLPFEGGIRVGVSGTARYDGGALVGISHPRSMVFRLPLSRCDFEERLFRIFGNEVKEGTLIYSPPGVGKTTALRALAGKLSKTKRLCIIDERGEFSGADLPYACVLSGYEKALGIEIALRTHSPEVIMVDELGAADVGALSAVILGGIPVIATAHGGSAEEILKKPGVSELISLGALKNLLGIKKTKNGYKLTKVKTSSIDNATKTPQIVN